MGYRHSKPDALKRAQGTMRNDRLVPNNLGENLPLLDIVYAEPPDSLDETGTKEWHKVTRQLSKIGLLHEVSLGLIESYCLNYQHMRSAAIAIEKDGMYLGEKVNPAFRVQQDCMKELRMLAMQFGFTPSSASRISLPNKPEKMSAFEKLKNTHH